MSRFSDTGGYTINGAAVTEAEYLSIKAAEDRLKKRSLTAPQKRLLTELLLGEISYHDGSKRVYVDGRRLAGNTWPTLLSLFRRDLVEIHFAKTQVVLTDAGRDALARLS